MSEILIFRFVDCEGPGFLGQYLSQRGRGYRLIAIDAGDPVPQSIDGTAGLVFMGGPMSVNDPLPWIEPVCELIRAGQSGGLPMLGHCLGGQLIARALGAHVGPNPRREIGWFDVHNLPPARSGWTRSLPAQFTAFHWHGETFSLPDGAQLLYSSRACLNQAFVLDRTLALQFHVEMLPGMVTEWADAYAHELVPSETVQARAELERDIDQRITGLHRNAERFYNAWLALHR